MRALITALCLGVSMASTPGLAQDATYEPEDAKLLHKCMDSVEAARFGDNPGPEATPPRFEDCIGVASNVCMDQPGNSSTVGMSDCMGRETAWWDEQLNTSYTSLRDRLETESFTALRDTQRAWIAYRDAECNFQYTYWRDGTIRSTFYSSCMLDLTARRAIALETVVGWAL